MSLFDALSQIAEQIKQHRELMNKSEATVEQVSVLPFVDALGYDTKKPAEVRRQYPILNMDAVDFAILRDGEPIMFLEAKKADENLNAKHRKQLFQYFNADKARIGILTNGVDYRFYSDIVKPNIMDKEPFLEIDLLKLDKRKLEVLEGFTKTRFDPIKSIRYMKVRTKVEQILNYPDEWLVKHVIYDIHEGAKWKNVIEEYRPLVKQAIDDYVEHEVAQRVVQPRPNSKPKKPDPSTTDSILPKPQTYLDGSVTIPVFA